jgi:hypothetical protein
VFRGYLNNLPKVASEEFTLVSPDCSNSFVVSVRTTVGKTYYLEATPTLINPNWTPVTNAPGNGLLNDLTDPSPGPQTFYRLRAQ